MGFFQPSGRADAEIEEDGQREHDDGGDNDDAKLLLFGLLHLDLIHMEHRVHLRQLLLHLETIDGVGDVIHPVVKLRGFFVVAQLGLDKGLLLHGTN